MYAYSIYTGAVVVAIGAALIAKVALLRRPHYDDRLLDDRRSSVLYMVSKVAPVLAVAFALAADAAGGTSPTNAALGIAALVVVAGLSGWTVHLRLSGRFFGLAHLLRSE